MKDELHQLSSVTLKQRFEVAELAGFETRNRYQIETEDGRNIGFVAEQQKGVMGFFLRQLLGHWRRFDLLIFDSAREPVLKITHPFRWIFQRFEISTASGEKLGAIQQRFSFHKSFDVEGPEGQVLLRVSSPLWRPWTFSFLRLGKEMARIEKKWSGLLAEAFTDKDRFRILFVDPELNGEDRLLVLAAGIFVDLQYFEVKARK